LPATVEAVFVLLVFLVPGFIAVQVKNSLLPYRIPSAFQEAAEAVVASTILLPVWWVFAWRLLHARAHVLEAIATGGSIDVIGVGAPVAGVIALVYFVLSPAVGIAYALVQTHRPYVRLARMVLPNAVSSEAQPEVWDRLFSGEEEQPWVIVWFRTHGAIGGAVRLAGVSPSGRQLLLGPTQGEPESLVRFNQSGIIVQDLTEKTEGVWIEIGPEVLRIDIFS